MSTLQDKGNSNLLFVKINAQLRTRPKPRNKVTVDQYACR